MHAALLPPAVGRNRRPHTGAQNGCCPPAFGAMSDTPRLKKSGPVTTARRDRGRTCPAAPAKAASPAAPPPRSPGDGNGSPKRGASAEVVGGIPCCAPTRAFPEGAREPRDVTAGGRFGPGSRCQHCAEGQEGKSDGQVPGPTAPGAGATLPIPYQCPPHPEPRPRLEQAWPGTLFCLGLHPLKQSTGDPRALEPDQADTEPGRPQAPSSAPPPRPACSPTPPPAPRPTPHTLAALGAAWVGIRERRAPPR